MRTRKHRGFILALVVIVEAVQEAEKAMCRPIKINVVHKLDAAILDQIRKQELSVGYGKFGVKA